MPESESTTSVVFKQSKQKKIGPKFELPRAQKMDLRVAFDLFDRYGVGYIEVKDLRVAIRALGYEPGKEEIMQMLSNIEKPKEGKISFSDFIQLMTLKITVKDPVEDVMKSFRLLDRDKTQSINFDNLKEAAQELGEDLNDEELKEMIDFADTNGDGEVSLNDFIQFTNRSSLRGEF